MDSGIEVQRPPTPGGGKGADSSVLLARLWGMSCLLSVPLLLSCNRKVMSSGHRRLQLDAGWHLVGAWLYVGGDEWMVGQKIRPSPQKGEEVQKCCDEKKKVEHYPLSR